MLLAVNAVMTPRFPMPTVQYHTESQQPSSGDFALAAAPDFSQQDELQDNLQTNEAAYNGRPEPEIAFPVNINTADAAALDTIKGIGPVIAQRIIDYRNEAGGFSSVEELLNVKGIGVKTLEKMLPFICLD